MSDSTPTERFSAATAPLPTTPAGEPPQSRKLLFILISVGAALLLATLILLIVLLTRGDGDDAASTTPTTSTTPTASASASASPSPSATPSESAVDESDDDNGGDSGGASNEPRFTSFTAPASVNGCSMGGPGADPFRPLVTVSWNSASAVSAWYVNGTSDAASAMFMEVPLAGDESDFEFDQYFPCNQETADFTITLVGDDGEHVSKTWTVENNGDVFS